MSSQNRPLSGESAAQSNSVMRQHDETTGQAFLQGRETADADTALVFADRYYNPIGHSNRPLVFEVEVKYRFFEGTVDDYAEVFSFWSKVWGDSPDGPQSEVMLNGEDFCANHEIEWGVWDDMLKIAVKRIMDARYDRTPFEPRLVGGLQKSPR
jgi:hypothetical protein